MPGANVWHVDTVNLEVAGGTQPDTVEESVVVPSHLLIESADELVTPLMVPSGGYISPTLPAPIIGLASINADPQPEPLQPWLPRGVVPR